MDIEVKENYQIKNLTTFRIGGAVEKLYFPKTQQEFIHLLKTLKKPHVFGNWSNVLISSNGIKGDVISTAKLANFEIRGTKVTADCGVKGAMLAQKALDNSLSGFEFMIAFPGSVGGIVYMNAGAHSQSVSDILISACVFDTESQEVLVIEKKDLGFAYRTSALQKKPYVLLSAEFELKKAEKAYIDELMKRNLDFRKEHQPKLTSPSAGSVFRNPENDSAGRLLDKAGVKEFSIGGAKVWENHANFIVNDGGATSADVLELMLKMQTAVEEKYTIKLCPEIKYFGKKSQREDEICNILYNQK